MYSVERTNTFKRSLKRCLKRGLDPTKIEECIRILVTEGKLPAKYKPHKLNSRFDFCWECHIEPDWLMLWHQNDNELTLLLMDTGTLSDLFG